jgi:molybdate transport system permease protein
MDFSALALSLKLALWTCVILIPLSILIARPLAWTRFRYKGLIEALIALPLVLPPTVLGFYLLVAFGDDTYLGQLFKAVFGRGLVFTFEGLLFASLIFNLPFAVQPIQRAFEAVPINLREAAWCSGMSNAKTFRRIELPLALPGVISALTLTFAHTMGEFGVVLMVGGNIPDETRTIAIAIYDRVQAFDNVAAGVMSLILLSISFLTLGVVYMAMPRWSGR